MGAILAAVIVFAVMGASLSLLYAHLDGVAEYNRRASEAADAQRRAVHESLGVEATSADGQTYSVRLSNERAEAIDIIDVRSMLPDGTVARLPEFEGSVSLGGFGEESLDYEVPDGIEGEVSIVAVTRMGNTFEAEIDTAGLPEGGPEATISGMGIGSRLGQAEYAGHVIYGSDSWSSEASLRPHVIVDDGGAGVPPTFAAIMLDSEAETSVEISGYSPTALVTVAQDGTTSSAPKPAFLAHTASRGDAPVSSSDGTITISGGRKTLLKLDPAMFGKTIILTTTPGNGRVEILTSPYGTLADTLDIQHIRDRCGGTTWKSSYSPFRFSSPIMSTLGWDINFANLDTFVIHESTAPALTLTEETITYSKSDSNALRLLHREYWRPTHTQSSISNAIYSHHAHSASHKYLYPGDHNSNANFFGEKFPYYGHPGEYTIKHNSTSVDISGSGILLRNDAKFFVAYEPSLQSRMNVTNDLQGLSWHGHTPLVPLRIFERVHHGFLFDGHYSIRPLLNTGGAIPPPHAIASSDATPSLATINPSTRWHYLQLDTFNGMPKMSFMEGALGNKDYVSLASVKFNMIVFDPVGSSALNSRPPYGIHNVTIDWGDTFCVIAERPYVVDHTIHLDAPAISVTMPERDETYARHLYAMVHTGGSPVTLGAVADDSIAGLEPSVPYRLVIDGKTLSSGVTTPQGTIPFMHDMPASFRLHTYPDSAAYRGSFSTIVFDPHNGHSVRVPTEDDKIYTVHTWAQIPVTGSVTVSDVEVRTKSGESLRLAYLDGEYSASGADDGRIWVPVIPGYFSIHMEINGVTAVLRYSDVLGTTPVKVIPASTSTVSRVSFDDPIEQIAASTGSSAYAIASSDGSIIAIISGTVSGNAHIEHKYRLVPLRPCTYDPLTGWIEAYKNGELVYRSSRIVDYAPQITTTASAGANGVTTARTSFTYDRLTINETVQVSNVSVGDFVEFHVHANIYAESAYPSTSPPTRCFVQTVPVHVSSDASATANIHGGSIIIG